MSAKKPSKAIVSKPVKEVLPAIPRAILKEADKLLALGTEISANVTRENFPKAIEAITRVRESVREIEAEEKIQTEELKKKLKPIQAQKLAYTKQLERLNETLAAPILHMLRTEDAANDILPREGSLGSRIWVVEKTSYKFKLKVQDNSEAAHAMRESIANFLKVPIEFIAQPSAWLDQGEISKRFADEKAEPVEGGAIVPEKKYHLGTKPAEILR